jgi:hypothetical protein
MKPLLPDIQRLEELRERGLNYQQIADWIEEHEGVRVSRMSVASKISRAGKSSPRPRYDKHLPWKVKAQHGQHYAAKMLRLLGRRDNGLPLRKDQENRLDRWLQERRDTHSIVAYVPNTGFCGWCHRELNSPSCKGFHYVDGEPGPDGIPIVRDLNALLRRERAAG